LITYPRIGKCFPAELRNSTTTTIIIIIIIIIITTTIALIKAECDRRSLRQGDGWNLCRAM
jgi:hypothetical protein